MRTKFLISVSIGAMLWISSTVAAQDPSLGDQSLDPAGVELFEKHIRPVLIDKCFACHSREMESIEGGLELDSSAGLAAGGESGSLINLEAVDSSLLLRVLRHADGVSAMPPDETLDQETVTAFEEWIRIGAPDPRSDSVSTAKEIKQQERLQHWSFQPPQSHDSPFVENQTWVQNSIDAFVLAKQKSAGVQPANDASRATLARRIYFDLIGLPPSPQQVARFVEDPAPDAIAKLVDHLLASPRFGENWARHWLDVVRFAETSGKEFNFTYPHAWPYRDYVIDAFNSDKSYDQFLREQIAGDLLPDEPYESDDDREDRLIAVSLLSFGPKRHNSGGTAFRMEIVDDQIEVIGKAVLGVTISCAKCHDHKFDPIPTQDYYALAGILLSTEPLYGTILQKYSNSPTELLPIGPDGAALHAAAEDYERIIDSVKAPWEAKKAEIATAKQAKAAAEKSKADAESAVATVQPDDTVPAEALKKANEEIAAATSNIAQFTAAAVPLEAAVKALEANRPPRPPYAMTARDRSAPADTTIAIRGDLGTPGEVAPRGFLSAISVPDVPSIDPAQSGRKQLAQWITSRHNPLTARVIVNRIWHHLFGRGIVGTVDNFGLIGAAPSHQDLLDTLAVEFMEDGWSNKNVIRKIMLSRTYQLSCESNAQNQVIDPQNILLWRSSPRRLPVESIRDAILAVSGQLDIKRPVGSPVTSLGDLMVRDVPTEKLQPPSNHRSIFLPVVRDYAPEMFDQFDFPSASLVSGKRAVTNVPTQALFLRNSEFIQLQAQHAAQRLLNNPLAAENAGKVDLAMQWAFARSATDEEKTAAMALVESILNSESELEDRETQAWAALFRSLFATAEFRYLVDIESPHKVTP